tara:strand:+ start:436 stop:792 length:357 start_codon:yes stop_codon:yes gene_type:complete
LNKIIIILIAISSIIIVFSFDVGVQIEHMVVEGYGIGLGVFLIVLSLRAYIKFRNTRMIFTSVAFGLLTTVLIDSLYENLSVVRDISHLDEEHIGENLLLAAMTVFGAGTLFDMKNKK